MVEGKKISNPANLWFIIVETKSSKMLFETYNFYFYNWISSSETPGLPGVCDPDVLFIVVKNGRLVSQM